MLRYLLLSLSMCWATLSFAAPNAHTEHFPDDGHILLHIDLQRLQTGQTPKQLLGLMMANPETKQKITLFQQNFGIDPFKDLKSLTMQIKVLEAKQEPLILVHVVGTFDQARLLKGLTAQGNAFTQETINGHVAHINAQNKSAITFVKDGVLMGTPERLRFALKGAQFGGILKEQQALLKQGGDLWFAAHLPERVRADIKRQNPVVADSKSMRGYLDFAQGLKIMIATEFVSPEVAAATEAQLKMMIDQAKQAPQAAMFMNMVNKVSISAEGPELTLDIPLTQDDVNQIQAIVSMMLMSLSMQQQQQQQQPPAGSSAPKFPKLNAPVSPSVPAPAPAPVPAVSPQPVAPAPQ